MLYPDDEKYFEELREVGFQLAKDNGIEVLAIEPKRRAQGAAGLTYLSEKRICIEVRGRQLMQDGGQWNERRWSHASVLHTLAHELAHLQEHQIHGKTSHGPRFREYEKQLRTQIEELK